MPTIVDHNKPDTRTDLHTHESVPGKAWVPAIAALGLFSAITSALVRPLWYDEVGTAIISGLPSFSQIWAALANAADAQPPVFFFLTNISRRVFSDHEPGLRFPAVAAFAVAMICLYVFTSRVWGRMAGLIAMLVLMCSQGLYYASEARPYGLMLACVGVAALLWQNRKRGNRSAVNLIGFNAALIGVCAFHYYGVFVVIVFGLVELVPAVYSRKPDWGVLMGLPLSVAPIIWAKPLIDASRQQITAGFWARPSFKAIAEAYVFALGNVPLNRWTLFHLKSGRPIGLGDVAPPLLLLATLAILIHRQVRDRAPGDRRLAELPAEILLASGLLLLPIIVGVAAMATLGGFTPRYTIAALIGTAILAAAVVNTFGRRATTITATLLTALFVCLQSPKDLSGMIAYAHGKTPASLARQRFGPLYQLTDSGTPVVIPDGYLFFESWYYSRPENRRELIYLQDRKMAMRFSGTDSFDVVNERLQPYMNLHLEDAGTFVRDHNVFLIANRGLTPSWSKDYLDYAGARYQAMNKGGEDLTIDRVFLPGPAAGAPLHKTAINGK